MLGKEKKKWKESTLAEHLRPTRPRNCEDLHRSSQPVKEVALSLC